MKVLGNKSGRFAASGVETRGGRPWGELVLNSLDWIQKRNHYAFGGCCVIHTNV